ncbi:class F sortase [Streptomyces sp. NPDC052051]|uniref:class F sortase n=1 Tax=Streptomyces sp. NPDC052051 TaxID=3154649 RepID=UPI003431C8A2
MTLFSRRALAASVLASLLLVGCGGPGDHGSGAAKDHRTTVANSPRTSGDSSGPAHTAHALRHSAPVRLRIPAIGVDTPVMRLGLEADGSVQVPPIAANDQAGWYGHSPTPGQVGPSVILGHATVGAYGDGVFRDLARLHQGERIVTRLENGSEAEFTVSSVRTVAKATFPTDAVYGDVDRPELRLITCGGPRTGDGYRDNVIVFATLSSTSP